ncbi:MAG: glycerophosphodiester phosphodiesterase family protein [Anaerolineae bacterium]|nr:glycerophosphodiester phosphodiesterase family protein [Anaerolineae bacterium]MDQ7035164.1 glycerophosphodiester phosphodiesterase family protein [Anaerolineae bacterium]
MDAMDVLRQIYGDGDTTLVFGHRGAKAYAPMNTITAFELAAEQGAHGIELDVQFSSDGELVILHDYTVDETTDGTGKVVSKSLDELKSLDAGSWFDPKFTGLRIPTLDEVFQAVGQSLIVNVEIKVYDLPDASIEQAIADCILRNKMQERVIISSFTPVNIQRMKTIAPDIPRGYLQFPYTRFEVTQPILIPEDYHAEHWHHTMIENRQMEYAKETGKYVNTWTVNEAARARQLRLMGVHCIITDNPDVILKALR